LRSHLCEQLLSEGYHVLRMDTLRTSSPENIAHLADEADLEYTGHDVTSHISVPDQLDEGYHFASPASHKECSRIPIPILKASGLETYKP
jgi:UDP-glucose 4-epimerase